MIWNALNNSHSNNKLLDALICQGLLDGSAASAGAVVKIALCLAVTGASVYCVNEGHPEQQLDLFILFPHKPSRKAGTRAAAHQGPENAICSHATP